MEGEQAHNKKICSDCSISLESSTHTRKCFMTGEYCSQKTNIQRERNKLHKKSAEDGITISAFVIMNFSDMSDVVYKWRIKDFIESLKKYLYVDRDLKRLYCAADKNYENADLYKVNEIKVIRADSDPASNYVICSRICQQMQIADLIIVDVSMQNPNVFYEFGMAVALDKLILPICFSESFYKIEYPSKVKAMQAEERANVEHHIGCYPWRKKLFEYYGIRYKQNAQKAEEGTQYLKFDDVTNEKYGFSDMQYNRFPYDAQLCRPEDKEDNREENKKEESKKEENKKKVGEVLYNKLRQQYNNAETDKNTLVVYTMEGFLNKDQAGRCIVNFYHSITERMQKEQCFCGERVGVLVQSGAIPESDKDAKDQRSLLYNVGEIIHIGVNQATYLAAKEKVESEDVFVYPEKILLEESMKNYKSAVIEFVKSHIRNRGMIIHPDNPIYVERINNLLPDGILEYEEQYCYPRNAFCLYHVMLKTLRYTNEIVVDISNNNLQALFWLGAAHGSEIYAVTVKHELSEKQRKLIQRNPIDNTRNVFDVAGLWTAYYQSYDTEGFYHQMALAQFGIEKHSKIIPFYASWRGLKKWEYFEDEKEKNLNLNAKKKSEEEKAAEKLKVKKLALESYYRRRFWNAMLRYNRLRIYLSQRDDKSSEDDDPRVRAAKWDMDAVSALTHYLSKRSVIGEYIVLTLPEKEIDAEAEKVNYICVGQPAKPFKNSLPYYINERCPDSEEEHINIVHEHYACLKDNNKCDDSKKAIQIKGFLRKKKENQDENEGLFMCLPWAKCIKCGNRQEEKTSERLYRHLSELEFEECPLKTYSSHMEIAQLILWREDGRTEEENHHFRVSIVGSSGPATYALSSLFVDEDQKLRDFLKNEVEPRNNTENTLLYELQKRIRERVYKLLMEKLKKEILKILGELNPKDFSKETREIYCNQVLYALHSYLSTVLYRFFLPFLTEKDSYRIYNGVYMFVNSMKAARQSPFCLGYVARQKEASEREIPDKQVRAILTMLPQQVREFLESFKGIEAFYQVKVEVKPEDENNQTGNSIVEKDWRKVSEIMPVDNQEINFFIVPQDEAKPVLE